MGYTKITIGAIPANKNCRKALRRLLGHDFSTLELGMLANLTDHPITLEIGADSAIIEYSIVAKTNKHKVFEFLKTMEES